MKIIKKILRFLLKIFIFFIVSTVVVVIIYRFVPPPLTTLMVKRLYDQAVDEKREVRLTKDWVPLSEIAPSLPRAVIASEDQQFVTHFGLDFKAIEKAQKYNEKHKGKKVKGASTISQQTAKNVFLWPDRSYLRKALEVYFTFLIEMFWSKYRIMEVYLNVIELGDGVYGAEAGAREHFNKSASKLTNAQSALIAACLPNPLKWSPARPTSYIKRKQAWILRHMNKARKPEFLE